MLATTIFVNAQTVGNIPKYATSSTFNNSALFQSGTNLGIGTTSPTGRFTVNNQTSTVATPALYLSYTPLAPGATGSANDYILVKQEPYTIFNYNAPAVTHFVVKGSSGYVGIGTATPNFTLDVNGTANVTGQLNAGTVVIGNVTTPAGYKLYVESGVLAEKFKCSLKSTSDWSDFVFDENYTLKSLAEVENYISENKHLPDVPSAEEVVCEGIDMAKMDAKLLQKIEELTLYLIEIEKENQWIKAELINLKNK
jgi:hypothetical protein